MADIKNQMYRHLRSARQWLTRAEEAFDKDSDIQGELNLFLAQAELQHFQEAKRSGQWRYKYPILRQGLALFFAAILMSASMGGYWWMNHRGATQQVPFFPPETSASLKMPQSIVETTGLIRPAVVPVAPAIVEAATPPAQTPVRPEATTVSVKQEENEMRQIDKVVLPTDEKQKLIRAAGKTLRGQ